MEIFKIDTKLFWTNELKSWLGILIFTSLLYIVLRYLSSLPIDKITVSVIVIFLLKIADMLTQFNVKEIQIDRESNNMNVILNSKMSGEKIKQYKLKEVSSQLEKKTSWQIFVSSPFTLKLFVTPKERFVLTDRYGFKLDTLKSVDQLIKSIHFSVEK